MNLNSLYHFTLYHLRPFTREPATLFWSFGFPLVLTIALALTFSGRNSAGTPFLLGMYQNPQMDQRFLAAIRKQSNIKIIILPVMGEEAEQALQKGGQFLNVHQLLPPIRRAFFDKKVDVIYLKGKWYSARSEAMFLSIRRTLLAIRARARDNDLAATHIQVPGIRFVDWFIPGMIGLTLLSSGVFGIATRISANRERGLFKRLRLAPNSKTVFILGLAIARGLILFSELIFLLLAFWLIFDFTIQGSFLAFIAIGMLASLCFCLLGAAIASRLKQTESAAGVANLFFMTMMFLSGVYFKIEIFPEWMQTIAKLFPLTSLNSSFRAIANEGWRVQQLTPELANLSIWSILCLLFTWKFFDWGTD